MLDQAAIADASKLTFAMESSPAFAVRVMEFLRSCVAEAGDHMASDEAAEILKGSGL